MAPNEATARIKINRLLEEAGWRFFDSAQGPANIVLEPNTKITESQIDAFGNDFEMTQCAAAAGLNGYGPPHPDVVNTVDLAGRQFIQVDDTGRSVFQWRHAR